MASNNAYNAATEILMLVPWEHRERFWELLVARSIWAPDWLFLQIERQFAAQHEK